MKSLRLRLVAMLLAAPLLSCGEPPGKTEPLDCQWFLSETNCWRTTIAPALACLPGSEEGAMNSERTSCAFPSGASVSFSQAVIPGAPASLTISNGSSTCLEYVDLGKGGHNFSIETSAGKFTETVDEAEAALTITCPGQEPRSITIEALEACGEQTGQGPVFEDFLVPALRFGVISASSSSGSSDGLMLDLAPAPSNPTSEPDGWGFTAFRCFTPFE